jgi:protein arginine N-methyltransferase 1
VRGTLIDGEYVWSWDWYVQDAAGAPRGQMVRQSSFLSRMFSPAALQGQSNEHAPELTKAIQIDRDCLTLIGDGRTLDAIARIIQSRYPDDLGTYKEALDHVAQLCARYR